MSAAAFHQTIVRYLTGEMNVCEHNTKLAKDQNSNVLSALSSSSPYTSKSSCLAAYFSFSCVTTPSSVDGATLVLRMGSCAVVVIVRDGGKGKRRWWSG